MTETEVVVKLPKNKISYDEYRDWCIKVGRLNGWDPNYCDAVNYGKPAWYLVSAKLPEDLAILFRLEFNV